VIQPVHAGSNPGGSPDHLALIGDSHAGRSFELFPGFYPGSAQVEALARLSFVQASGQPVGHLHGDPGCGKTWVLRRFVVETRREDRELGYLDVAGRDGREMLLGLADLLGVRIAAQDARYQLWQAISDRLREHRLMGWTTQLLFDHVDEAGSEVPGLLSRLAHVAESPGSRLTLIVATTRLDALRVHPGLDDRVGLRIAVEPWSAREVGDFAGRCAPAAMWHPESIDMLWRLSDGRPRDARRLIELGLQAARLEQLPAVSADLLECVQSELLARI
jgi:type II secretory pathway predicted ATPase ExeA